MPRENEQLKSDLKSFTYLSSENEKNQVRIEEFDECSMSRENENLKSYMKSTELKKMKTLLG